MKKLFILVLGIAFMAEASLLAQAQPNPDSDLSPLNNRDIVAMVERRVLPEAIVQAIESSACTFDTFPPVILDLRRRGVPDLVLQAMLRAPYGPPIASRNQDELGEAPIYHYAEQLKAMGVLTPTSGRRMTRSARARMRRSTVRRQMN